MLLLVNRTFYLAVVGREHVNGPHTLPLVSEHRKGNSSTCIENSSVIGSFKLCLEQQGVDTLTHETEQRSKCLRKNKTFFNTFQTISERFFRRRNNFRDVRRWGRRRRFQPFPERCWCRTRRPCGLTAGDRECPSPAASPVTSARMTGKRATWTL